MSLHLLAATPFHHGHQIFDQLPDELLLHILSFTTSDPIAIIKYSHISKRMERILNSNPNVISQMITYEPLDSTDKRLRNGYFIGKFWENPLKNSVAVLKEFLARVVHGRRSIHDRDHFEVDLFSEMKAQVDSKQKIVDCLKWSRKDPKKIIKVVECWANNFQTNHLERLIYSVFTVISLSVQISFGKFASVPMHERSLDKGLWWLPYSFWPFEGTLIVFILACVGTNCFNIVRALRSLVVNPPKYWRARLYDGIVVIPMFCTIFATISQLGIILMRTLIYESTGLALSGIETFVSTIFRYLHYPGLTMLGFLSLNNLTTVRGIGNLYDPITASFVSLSLFKQSGNLLSFIPLSLVSCAISIKELISNVISSDKWFDLIPMGLGISLGLFSVGHFSYFTFAPTSFVFTALLTSAMRKRRNVPLVKNL